MKYLFVLTILLSAQKECSQKPEIPLADATSQFWSGGAAATRGTYYKMYLLLKDPSQYEFDSLWVDEKRLPVSLIKPRTPNDTAMVMANDVQGILNPMKQGEMSNSVPSEFPIKVDATGVMGYFHEGKRGYLPIPKWRVLKSVTYQ